MKRWQSREQRKELLLNLVQIPSVTGSISEVEIPKYIVEQINKLEYFQLNEGHVRLYPTDDGRQLVTALVKRDPQVKKTVILVSHFDVVDVQDYGSWKEKAFHAQELTELFYSSKQDMPLQVQKDMEQGRWLFGRGTMDMKCGLVMHMSMLEKAALGELDGNVLLLAVPDEEANSVGMRAAVPALLELAREFELEYQVVLNSEPMFARYPGDLNQYIYTGSIGKILPGFLCYGKETHVGEPFSGLNANLMASQVTCEMELNTEFCEVVEGEVTPPPTNLIQMDLKEEYSVQIPHRAVTLFNLFLYERSMTELQELLVTAATRAAGQIEQSYKQQSERFSRLEKSKPGEVEVKVKTFSELMEYATEVYGTNKVQEVIQTVTAARGDKDDRDATISLVDEIAILCKDLAPMIVVFFAPPFYPAISSRNHPLVEKVVKDMVDYAKVVHGLEWLEQNYFGGISDLSYAGLQFPVDQMSPLVNNMPLWNQGYSLPLKEMEEFDVPVLNIGPVGRDAHKWTERLDEDYAFDILPDVLEVAIKKLLK
ncbi:M20/M25/M40 family metallo-hydrolase [Ammoniphilus sp. CFH 90114]|uniref:M20/M25/M40 family metallo-hydrolase n=1 Tax=Ammoniphilus sp. CFH 90114 TaxID=2493665 RepID=UPI00100E062F|nr:M20/M25/M40 family metallo-hydrolase [Ammoniphilus sp. CFH 90114]RXT08771.1 M20/M25/M40 family metallo-hydrolase [Ammoniphilus sp. CFH 90114]